MNKYFVGILCSILSISCINISVDSNVSLEHDYTLNKVSPVVNGILKDCYHPDFSHQFQKLNHLYHGLSWKMINLQDEIKLSTNHSINHLVLEIMNGDDSIILERDIYSFSENKIVLIGTDEDNLKLKSVLSKETSLVCLTADSSTNDSVWAHDNITFDIDLDYKL